MTTPLPTTTPDLSPGARRRRVLVKRVLPALVSLAIVVGVFWFFLPQFTSLSDVWTAIQSMTWLELVTLAIAAVWNLVTYWLLMVATMPGLRVREAAVVTQSGTAVSNTLPAGGAVGIALNFAMFDSWGFSRSRSSVSLTVSGIFNNFAKLGLPVLALALLLLQGTPSRGRVIAGLLGLAGLAAAVVLFALLLRSDAAAARIGAGFARAVGALRRPFGKGPVTGWDRATVKFRSRTVLLLRARWYWIALATLVSHLSLFLVLLLALRDVGVSEDEVSWIEVLAVFAFARLLTAIPFTPGGLGVVELALITGLSAAGGDRAEVTAATLVFRALTYVLPIPIGLATYVFWRRNTSWRRPPNSAPRTPLVPEQT